MPSQTSQCPLSPAHSQTQSNRISFSLPCATIRLKQWTFLPLEFQRDEQRTLESYSERQPHLNPEWLGTFPSTSWSEISGTTSVIDDCQWKETQLDMECYAHRCLSWMAFMWELPRYHLLVGLHLNSPVIQRSPPSAHLDWEPHMQTVNIKEALKFRQSGGCEQHCLGGSCGTWVAFRALLFIIIEWQLYS